MPISNPDSDSDSTIRFDVQQVLDAYLKHQNAVADRQEKLALAFFSKLEEIAKTALSVAAIKG